MSGAKRYAKASCARDTSRCVDCGDALEAAYQARVWLRFATPCCAGVACEGCIEARRLEESVGVASSGQRPVGIPRPIDPGMIPQIAAARVRLAYEHLGPADHEAALAAVVAELTRQVAYEERLARIEAENGNAAAEPRNPRCTGCDPPAVDDDDEASEP